MNDNEIIAKAILKGLYLKDKEFSEAFKPIEEEIKNPFDELDKKVLIRLKKQGSSWIDFSHSLAFSNMLMLEIYNKVSESDSNFKREINIALLKIQENKK